MKRTIYIFFAIVMMLSISACNLVELEQDVKKAASEAEKRETTPAETAAVTLNETTTEAESTEETSGTVDLTEPQSESRGPELSEDGFYLPGSTVRADGDQESVIDYVIEEARIYGDIGEAGLPQSEIDRISATYSFLRLTDPFVTAKVKVKIIQNSETYKKGEADLSISGLYLQSKKLIAEDSRLLSAGPEMVYFDQHPEITAESRGTDYFHYRLDEGEEATFTVGWILNDFVTADDELVVSIGADIKSPLKVDLQLTERP